MAKLSATSAPDARRVGRRALLGQPGTWLDDLSAAALSFWRDNAPGMAGMIAFFAFLALIPLVLLLLAFVGNVLNGAIRPGDVRHLFHSAVPGLSQQQFLDTFWKPVQHSKVATTILGIVSLFLGSLGLHDAVDWALNQIWRAPGAHPFWMAKLRGLGVIVWVVGFVVLSLWLTWVWVGVLDSLHVPARVSSGGAALVPSLILDVGIFGLLYKLTPTVRVDTQAAFAAAALAATLWEISKLAFGWWVLQVGTYNRVYGPLAASVIVMLWLWISGMIFLYGAELAATTQRRRESRLRRPGRPMTV